MEEELIKLAHGAILQLKTENEELLEKLAHTEEAVKVAFSLYNNGQLAAEHIESKIKEYSTKSINELDVIKKASELTKVASSLNSFKLSDIRSFEGTSPEDRFAAALMAD